MKRIILSITCLVISISFVFSQANTFPATGNAGIGTTSPVEKLHIQNGNLQITGVNVKNTVMGTLKFSTTSYPSSFSGIAGRTNNGGLDQLDLLFFTSFGGSSEKMRIMSNTGYVGIGTSAPTAKLDVRGAAVFGTSKLLYLNPDYPGSGELPSGAYIGTNGANSLTLAPSTSGGVAGAKLVLDYHSSTWRSALEIANVSSGYGNLLLMKSGGIVGINTTTPNANAILDVNGNIFSSGKIAIGITDMGKIGTNSLAVNGSAIFTKAIVKLSGNWPDYVFDSKYKLPKLDSLEQFIKLNGHLPEVPKTEEVEKNGIDLGSNQALLLKKIEELTLIVIEQNKRIEKLEKELLKKDKQN